MIALFICGQDAIRYSIDPEGDDRLRFAMNPTTGQITLRAKLDSESNTEYRVSLPTIP